MKFNWFTVIAQIVNFLILVWLLKLFLYKPVLTAMANRQQHLIDLEGDLLTKKRQAEEMQQTYTAMTKNLEQNRLETIALAHKQAEEEHQLLITAARTEIENMKQGWKNALQREQFSFQQEGSILIGKESIRIARTVLSDLAGVELEELMIRKFTNKFAQLTQDEIAKLHLGIEQDNHRIMVFSAFKQSLTQRKLLTEVLQAQLGADITVDFAINGQLLGGIDIDAGGYHLGWSIEESLHELEDKLGKYFGKNIEGAGNQHDQ